MPNFFSLVFSNVAKNNKVKNIGNSEVWSDQTHDDRTEIWGDEWKNGLVYVKFTALNHNLTSNKS